jgi:hypothetical protein
MATTPESSRLQWAQVMTTMFAAAGRAVIAGSLQRMLPAGWNR